VAAVYRSKKELNESRPDVLLAMGGYASVGPVLAARMCGIPVVLHEGNAVPGKALKFLSRWAHTVAVNFEHSAQSLNAERIETLGFPIRKTLIDAAKRQESDAADSLCILVAGGSQGASFLNKAVPPVVEQLVEAGSVLKVLHVAGEADRLDVEKRYAGIRAEVIVHGFVHDMGSLYREADLAISRSGASACAELSVFGVPSVFVPFPAAKDDHQTKNARHYADAGGAIILTQHDFDGEGAKSALAPLLKSETDRLSMSDGMLACARINAATDLAELVESVGAAADAHI
jgi:UDP-N-acetylglucosamine--N-acetylmuramyl-(pentapeptide) pyrophosphoryl-undecaprenol N-acetylglucosamine transferase